MSGRGDSLYLSTSGAIRRAIWSAPPPVPAGTTNSMGFVGSHASTEPIGPPSMATPSSPKPISIARRAMVPPCLEGARRRDEKGLPVSRQPFPGCDDRAMSSSSFVTLVSRHRDRHRRLAERHDARDVPVLPHLVDFGLEVGEILLVEVGEAPLLQQVLTDRLPLAPLHD